jgi:hypothetical protein
MRLISVTLGAVALAAMLAIGAVASYAAAAQDISATDQMTFASADEAVTALIGANKAGDLKRLVAVLGPGSHALVISGDRHADAAVRERFVAAYDEHHKLTEASPGRMILTIGANDWPMPIPVVMVNGRWHFDSPAAAQEIVNRRIGRNEIAAIRVALTYVEAQQDYFERSKENGGTGHYAQRLVSTPDHHDGLYWPAGEDEPDSPFGPLVAQAIDEGYPGDIVSGRQVPYQGYYFRVLKSQGDNVPGGAKDYMVGGRLTGGFALVASPAIYGTSGIMTFVVDQDGVVFQKDLGPRTTAVVAGMTRYDPDLTWARVDLTND